MTDLLRFLLARLTDEEYHVHHPAQETSRDQTLTTSGWWSPARVIAECEAKRRILLMAEQPQRWPSPAAQPDPDTVQAVLRYLALPYADHPDYRPEWRP